LPILAQHGKRQQAECVVMTCADHLDNSHRFVVAVLPLHVVPVCVTHLCSLRECCRMCSGIWSRRTEIASRRTSQLSGMTSAQKCELCLGGLAMLASCLPPCFPHSLSNLILSKRAGVVKSGCKSGVAGPAASIFLWSNITPARITPVWPTVRLGSSYSYTGFCN
jgi:hypothetical protein